MERKSHKLKRLVVHGRQMPRLLQNKDLFARSNARRLHRLFDGYLSADKRKAKRVEGRAVSRRQEEKPSSSSKVVLSD